MLGPCGEQGGMWTPQADKSRKDRDVASRSEGKSPIPY